MVERDDAPDLRAGLMDAPDADASGVTLRLARETDAEALVEFNRAMARETESLELSVETLTAGVRNLLRSPQFGFYVVAERSDEGGGFETVGSLMITYEWSDWRDGLFWWVQSVYVKPQYRRQGIYRRLYEYVKRMAESEPSVRGFRLYVEKGNAAAQATYESLGMKETHYMMFEETL